jgi:hypothetical protein
VLIAAMTVGSCNGSTPTLLEAAGAALSAGIAKTPNSVAACVGFDTGDDVVDFPRTVTDALAKTRPAVRPVSSCFFDRQRMLYRIVQNGDPVPLFACGAARTLDPPRDRDAVRVECGIYRGGPLNAVGWGFQVHRTFWGSLTVLDLGQTWVS